jgi:long-chain acyl-CoA synthetase
VTSNVATVTSIFPLRSDDCTLSFLPWAHVFGQTCELHILLSIGASTAINDQLSELVRNLAEVKPTILVAVPRIFNKIHAGVLRQIAEKPAVVRALFSAGLRNAKKYRAHLSLRPLERVSLALADKLVFSKIRARFGGRLRYAVSGSAALSTDVAEFVDALGIDGYEGYGLTETSPVVSMNRPEARKLGSVGKVIPGVSVVIDRTVSPDADSGEIIVYGPNVMKGYNNRPEENAKALMPDGGFRTGDLGRLDEDGYLAITGRIKEQYKLENGKYVMPSPLEERLKLSPYVANAMLFGENRPFNVAIIVPDMEAVRSWARDNHVELPADLEGSHALRSMMGTELEKAASAFRGFEKPRRFVLTLEDFTPENGLLTPTLKIKRRRVVDRYSRQIEALYASVTETSSTAPESGPLLEAQ